ncbi:hypothetical protein B0H17DRAFT_1108034 [Mycena rosella]|uniref:FAD/NAD(P)-binding domain-containing protein n=1 Tax=Mycena rosella TaxID=1033263 RepID=A0AAD7BXV6_MYCRO|nr:hypothetical protein B0H17DRAFT_1108034 [Mycena rosella]
MTAVTTGCGRRPVLPFKAWQTDTASCRTMFIHAPSLGQWLASAVFLLVVCITGWQKFCKSPPAWIKELSLLGQPRKHKLPGTAVICGGSIAGIITARICADHFERVIVIDPEIQDAEKPKTRIMQYNAGHIFLSLFIDGARRLWPSLDTEIQAAGGRTCFADFQVHYSGALLPAPYQEYSPGKFPDTLVIRRSLAQKVLHRLLIRHPTASNITVLPGIVRGVDASEDKTSIQSVVVRKLDGTSISLHDIGMVADCTGTTQAGLKWLRAAGFDIPDHIRHLYNVNMRYVTLCFDVPPALAAKLPIPEAQKKTMAVHGYVPHDNATSSLIALFITDNNTMQMMIANTTDELPKSAPDVVPFIAGFKGYALPIPSWVIETIQILCEEGNPSFNIIKTSSQSYVQYHCVPPGAIPSNFVAFGDASLQLNPIHGQGFGKIMMNGIALNSLLHGLTPHSTALPMDFSARYFKSSASSTHSLWEATRLHDYGLLNCEPMQGETKDSGRFMRWFELKVLSAATKDEEVASALWHVRHMRAADKALLAPTVLWKILRTRSIF